MKKNILFTSLLSFRLGFNGFSMINRDVNYYKSVISKKYEYNGKMYIDDSKLLDYINDAFKYKKELSFNHIINNFLSFTEKSNIFKILKITGISSIVIGLSDIKNHLDGDFLYFFKIFGLIYIIYNFMVLLLRTVSLFSKLFCLINNDFPLFILLESKKEKFFYVLGMLTHFILDVILILVSTILQCYIVDLYFYSVFETKIFCLDIIFVKFLIKKT